jgi:hypothetical protein
MGNWDVRRVKYFTAPVRGFLDPDQPERQQDYWNALKACYPSMMEIVLGRFFGAPQTLSNSILSGP